MLDHPVDRRAFNLAWVYALLGGATITIAGCGSDNSTSPAPRMPDTTADVTGVIANNHGHVAVITGAELMSGGGLQLNIQGAATHNHVVSLSAADVVTIRGGGRVSVTSTSTNSHDHAVTFN
jgi:hypothetical protein